MKVLIIYSTVTGTALEAAELLKGKLTASSVELCNIEETTPTLDGFDTVVVGGAIRFGRFSKKLRRFISENSRELAAKRTGYFVCCAFSDRVDDYFEDALTDEIRRNSIFLSYFGGTLKVERQKNIFVKLLVRSMRNEISEYGESDDESMTRIIPELLPSEINRAADTVNKIA